MSASLGYLYFGITCATCVFRLLMANHYDFDFKERSCPTFINPAVFYSGTKVPSGSPLRAYQTIPPGFSIRPSGITQAGLGVFSTTFIPKYTWLGEYEGEFLPVNYSRRGDVDYSWEIHSKENTIYHVDASDVRFSNWLRFINCSRKKSEENVDSKECYGRMYYITKKDIPPERELFVYYGCSYARALGIDMKNYENA